MNLSIMHVRRALLNDQSMYTIRNPKTMRLKIISKYEVLQKLNK